MTHFDSYVAIGDSFTEGLNDTLPDGSFRGWADRLAEILADGRDDFRYANLAIRGKMLAEIMEEQLPVALDIRPDLVTVCAGGNDIIVPGADVDEVAAQFEQGIARLREAGIEVLIFTGPDTKRMSVMSILRSKVGIYNAHLWAIADRHGAKVVDLWAMNVLHDARAWSDDRLHFTPEGHRRIALRAAEVLGVPTESDWREPWPENAEPANWLTLRRSDLEWTKTHLLPWIRRQLRGESMGDGILPKRPQLAPLVTSQATTATLLAERPVPRQQSRSA
ncbi:SGNH/GDSL hydrolase family protein [Saccharomonospora azurea]|uniref:Lysophospholipase L1-like esterase n=1 Tax=Saccharomonospora azurea NA-128 TaxID=882081 RepID=H8G4P6_9PSEU|nr:SGNH/GDSL hydrolase family protein [Saccharomonospora azurea]EHK87403.1 lysophospholipase L1-like esterase [Saccharomonospora azurea SZMC 14600]EHY89149.1 lysophospholipase L1-like esterase [Saccharomonospora azurea NA-128]